MATMAMPRTSAPADRVRLPAMMVTATEAAARLGGYDSPIQVAVEHGLAPGQVNVPAVDLRAHAGPLLHGEQPLDVGGFAVVARGSR